MVKRRLTALLMGVSIAALGAPLVAWAADGAADAAADGEGNKVTEVVVTGALRTQRLQDAPMAVTAVPAQEFTNAGFKEPRELQFLSPSIQVSIQGANAIYIRGSGTNSQNGGTEQSVGMVIDGVLMGFVDDIGGDISDLDHIEVYRGPQGTQFAKNASAGVVSVMTKKPVLGATSFDGHFSYGQHNDTADNMTVNIPINDTMAARLTASFQHRDGVFENAALGIKQSGREQKGLRAKFMWRPDESTNIYVSADVRQAFDKPNFPQAWAKCGPGINTPFINYTGTKVLPGCNSALIAGITPSDTNSVIAERDDAYRHTDAGGVSVQADHMIGDFTVTSLTAYRFFTRAFHGPSGSGYYNNQFLSNWYNGGQVSEELRLVSPAQKKLTYVAGIFLYDRNTVTKALSAGDAYGQAFVEYPNTPYGRNVQTASAGGETRAHNINKSAAVYADGSYHFTDKLLLNAGARVTRDDISASIIAYAYPGVYPSTVNAPLRPTARLETKETGYTYRIGPQYYFTPDVQIYGTFAHGYKGPLIDTALNVLDAIKPETVNMLEVGLKSSWFEHRLTANVTVFHQKFKNYQVSVLNQQVTPNIFQLGNAGGMLSKGVEVELIGRPTPELTLTASTAINDNHYTDFVTSCWNALEPIKQATSGLNGCYVHPGNTTASANAAGTPLINSSKYTYRLGASYNHAFGNGFVLDGNANYLHRSKWLSAPMDPNIVNPGYGVLNLNAGLTSPDGRYRVGVFARNALDKFFLAGRQANNGGWTNVLNPEAVRTVGVSLDVHM
ncbi:MAG: TonB-dependent receptor [Caulobacterales bacterium]|nr:TonB-dependent receptor [Caulobacterales bacterium]